MKIYALRNATVAKNGSIIGWTAKREQITISKSLAEGIMDTVMNKEGKLAVPAIYVIAEPRTFNLAKKDENGDVVKDADGEIVLSDETFTRIDASVASANKAEIFDAFKEEDAFEQEAEAHFKKSMSKYKLDADNVDAVIAASLGA